MLPPPTAMTGIGAAERRLRSTAASSMRSIASRQRPTKAASSPRTREASPRAAHPAATAMSVAVSTSPPNTRARRVNSKPTLCGPMRGTGAASSTSEPPPSPMLNTSGIRKLVRTPPTSTVVDA